MLPYLHNAKLQWSYNNIRMPFQYYTIILIGEIRMINILILECDTQIIEHGPNIYNRPIHCFYNGPLNMVRAME